MAQGHEVEGVISKLTPYYAVIDASGLGSTQVYAHRRHLIDQKQLIDHLSPGNWVFFIHERVEPTTRDPVKRQYSLYAKQWRLNINKTDGKDIKMIENSIGFVVERTNNWGVIWAKESNFVFFSQKVCALIVLYCTEHQLYRTVFLAKFVIFQKVCALNCIPYSISGKICIFLTKCMSF